MAKTLPHSHSMAGKAAVPAKQGRTLDWRKKISDHVAWGLLVYTGLQIFLTVESIKGEGTSILPYLALVVLVGGIIPACRAFEKRWEKLDDTQAADPSHSGAFKRSVTLLWVAAIGLPVVLTGLFSLVSGN
ncbi:hypothetical protein [Altererythrobacter aquiaggeris]|uniref:hypothetical protein n=1 Tax=Aestuarierythrobacter aquiaggeris TaxID=1898396 RepID=UPI00301B1D8E